MPTFFETNAKNGTVTRIHINPGPSFTFDTILAGLAVNNGVPGNILAPAGLTYDKASDTLYVGDSNANRVIKIAQATTAPASTYATTAMGFNSPSVSVVYSGAPLGSPISSALLANGNLVVGNTTDNNLVEINPVSGTVVSTKLVDRGAAGAIFGIVTTGGAVRSTSTSTTITRTRSSASRRKNHSNHGARGLTHPERGPLPYAAA